MPAEFETIPFFEDYPRLSKRALFNVLTIDSNTSNVIERFKVKLNTEVFIFKNDLFLDKNIASWENIIIIWKNEEL